MIDIYVVERCQDHEAGTIDWAGFSLETAKDFAATLEGYDSINILLMRPEAVEIWFHDKGVTVWTHRVLDDQTWKDAP